MMKRKKLPTISVVGLGKLGTPFLVTVASRGYQVIGVDLNPNTIQNLNDGKSNSVESKLALLLKQYHARIRATASFAEAILNSELTFIIVPTPSTSNGSFSPKHVAAALKNIGQVLREKSQPHVIAIVSTLSPGSLAQVLAPILEKSSGKKIGKNFGLCYNPSFIALGNVINNLLKPDFVLIGESDQKSGDILEKFYRRVCLNQPPIKRMQPINAEIKKIALNTFITTKISFANMLAQLCERVPGADSLEVTQALGLDSRIGSKYLLGSVPYGGPCFPRDNRALRAFGKKNRMTLGLPRETDVINQSQIAAIARLVEISTPPKNKIGVIGLAYKPETDVVDESVGINLANYLAHKKCAVSVYDPLALENARRILDPRIAYATSLTALVNSCKTLIVTTAWLMIKYELPKLLTKNNRRSIIIIDCWRIFDHADLPNHVTYIGRGQYIRA